MTKILAIDDQPDNLTTIKAIIKMAMPDFKVIFAKSGKEGILVAENEKPDVILLDIVMPEMDGYKTCELLKKNASTNTIPVVMVTAIETNAESKAKAYELGADAFLTKPIEPVEPALVASRRILLKAIPAFQRLRTP